MLQAATYLSQGAHPSSARAVTSDLTVDEALLLHARGWEPVELVFGVSVTAVQAGAWTWGRGLLQSPSEAHNLAVGTASSRLRQECAGVGGHGVVGVRSDVEIHPRHVDVALVGTAIRPIGSSRPPAQPFVSGLSARDFVLLLSAGWSPIGLAFGASFVYAPRRDAASAVRQSRQNVELTNPTQALYAAREAAMERMQASGQALGAHGVVGVEIAEGPMAFARHVIGFTARGTAVRLTDEKHRSISPQVVLPLNDLMVQFKAESLRGRT
jgi:uncharacterized protein YbjQ (UPF0145 family)